MNCPICQAEKVAQLEKENTLLHSLVDEKSNLIEIMANEIGQLKQEIERLRVVEQAYQALLKV
ncbi:hypothetical protein C0966_00605 [Bacillus methanolicus]|uniref:hypothetical protein n=1 Tax=Bacillus methanolicus TaxID=1471 RepID=UPI002380B9FD|nr:hypothetical protein [Bacillus methanolicus]MDE3837909.1 hypothetical protein [Bacillus methanolicus]